MVPAECVVVLRVAMAGQGTRGRFRKSAACRARSLVRTNLLADIELGRMMRGVRRDRVVRRVVRPGACNLARVKR